jgi:hypothetical protein
MGLKFDEKIGRRNGGSTKWGVNEMSVDEMGVDEMLADEMSVYEVSVYELRSHQYIATFSIPRSSKIYPNWYFWSEKKQSGNPACRCDLRKGIFFICALFWPKIEIYERSGRRMKLRWNGPKIVVLAPADLAASWLPPSRITKKLETTYVVWQRDYTYVLWSCLTLPAK